MKGLYKDLSAVVDKGTGKDEYYVDYHVGEFVFTEWYICSAGADHGFRKLGLFEPLRRQEDVVLEEYDRSNGGILNTCEVITLQERFFDFEEKWERWIQSTGKFFLFGIANPEEVVTDWAIARQENLPDGTVFVVYELCKEDYELAKTATSFKEAVRKILAEGQVAKNITFIAVSNSSRYAHSVWLSHTEYCDATCYRLTGSYLEKDKTYSFPLGGMDGLVNLVVKDHKVTSTSVDTDCSWANSQDWWYVKNLPPVMEAGRIIIDGKDVANDVLAWRAEFFLAEEAKKKERTAKFEELRDKVLERFGASVVRAATKGCPKGEKIRTLQVIAASDSSNEVVLHYLRAGAYGPVLANCLSLESAGISRGLAKKLAPKASAWRYLFNAGIPAEVISAGYFSDAVEALSLYGKGREQDEQKKNSWGEYRTLAEALKRAGL